MIDVYEVIHLPEWEAPPVCNDEALHLCVNGITESM